MRLFARITAIFVAACPAVAAAEWQVQVIPVDGRVTEVRQFADRALIAVGQRWFRLDDAHRLSGATAPEPAARPAGALPDTRIATGTKTFSQAWLADPTRRYRHGVLGDDIEAGSVVIEYHDNTRKKVEAGADAVFEDIEPRVATIGGAERIVVVKSYLNRGAALAVIAPDAAEIVAESAAIGHANAWRNPAGIADYDGDGVTDIAAVRQPHVVGRLELWSFVDGRLKLTKEVADVCNHVIGSRAINLSATADFDGDGKPDLAIPSFDRRSLRLIAFAPALRDIARAALPARVVTDLAIIRFRNRPAVVAGLDDGRLVVLRYGAPR